MGRAGALTGQPELDNFSPLQILSAHLTSHRTTLSTTPRPVGALDGERPTGVLVAGNGVLAGGRCWVLNHPATKNQNQPNRRGKTMTPMKRPNGV